MADGKILVEIDLDEKKAKKQLDNVESNAKKVGANIGQSISSGFKTAFAGLIGFQAIRSVFSAAVSGAREFSRATAEVNSILGQNNKLTKETTETFKEFAKQFGTEAATQARAFYAIVSAGVQGTTKQLKVLQQANEAAVAGLVDIDTAAKALVSSVNSYANSGLTAKEASDSLFVAVREGQTTFGELASTIGRVAPLAAAAGVKFNELSGALAFVTKSGVSTDEAVTGIRALLTSIIKPSAEAAQFAKSLGIEFNTAALRSKGLAGFLNQLIVSTKGNEQQLAKLFPNVRALSTVINVARGDFEDFKRILDETNKSAGATTRAAAELKKSLDFQISQLDAEFKVLATTLGEFIVPILLDVVKGFNAVSSVVKTAFGKGTLKDQVAAVTVEIGQLSEELQRIQEQQTEGAGFRLNLLGGEGEDQAAKLEQQILDLVAKRDELVEQIKQDEKPTVADTLLGTAPKGEDPLAGEAVGAFKGSESAIESFKESVAASKKTISLDLKSLAKSFQAAGASIKITNGEIAKNTILTFGRGVASAFAAFGASLVNGENAFKAFAKAFIGILGDIAIQLGTSYILQGIAASLNPLTPGVGAPLIGAGAALATFGGILKAVGGGGGGGAAAPVSAASLGTPSFTAEPLPTSDQVFDEDEIEEGAGRTTASTVTVNVQGDVLDSEETGLRIVQLINESFDTSGTVITQPA